MSYQRFDLNRTFVILIFYFSFFLSFFANGDSSLSANESRLSETLRTKLFLHVTFEIVRSVATSSQV